MDLQLRTVIWGEAVHDWDGKQTWSMFLGFPGARHCVECFTAHVARLAQPPGEPPRSSLSSSFYFHLHFTEKRDRGWEKWDTDNEQVATCSSAVGLRSCTVKITVSFALDSLGWLWGWHRHKAFVKPTSSYTNHRSFRDESPYFLALKFRPFQVHAKLRSTNKAEAL